MPRSRRISAALQEPDVLKKLLTISSILFCLVLPAAAQTPPAAAPVPPPAPDNASAPYDGELQRLAEILGSLQYLRTVCGAKEGQKWRAEMQSLLDAEAPGGERRRRIVARFNSGYRGFEQTYRTCTPAADLAIRRYLDEGAKIAREITARYAN
jgi:uncharacterized protein (TIGR02301 family)